MAAGDRSGHPVRRAPRVVYIWPRFRVEFWFTGLEEHERREASHYERKGDEYSGGSGWKKEEK